jgi:hypothetical protein
MIVLDRSKHPCRRHHATLHGVVFDILVLERALRPGKETEEFIEWASQYEDGDLASRSLVKHEAWLAALPCPVLRLDGSRLLSELVAEARGAIDG